MPLRDPDEIEEAMDVLYSSTSGLLRSFMTPVWRTGRSRHNSVYNKVVHEAMKRDKRALDKHRRTRTTLRDLPLVKNIRAEEKAQRLACDVRVARRARNTRRH